MKIEELGYHQTPLGELILRRRSNLGCKTGKFSRSNSATNF